MRRNLHILLIAALLLPTTACSRDDQGKQHQAMDAMATDTATGPIQATGIIRDLDLAAGTITVDHDPIAALGWGAMTMRFTAASPAILKDLSTGDPITFDLESPAKPRTVMRIEKR